MSIFLCILFFSDDTKIIHKNNQTCTEDEARLDLFTSTGTNTTLSVLFTRRFYFAHVYDCVHVQLFWGGGVSCVLFSMLSCFLFVLFLKLRFVPCGPCSCDCKWDYRRQAGIRFLRII